MSRSTASSSPATTSVAAKLLLGVASLASTTLLAHASSAQESEWPREITIDEGTITLYQPQVDSLDRNDLAGRAAVSWRAKDSDAPVFGAIWFESRLETDRDTRIVTVTDTQVPSVRFPEASDEEQAQLAAILEREVANWDLTFPLDELLASLGETGVEEASGLRFEPPVILLSKEPAVLVSIEGEPRFEKIQGIKENVERVVNTPFVIVRDVKKERIYLAGGDELWYEARDPLGPYEVVKKVPKYIAEIVLGSSEQSLVESSDAPPPKVVVATEPTELIVTDGEPKWAPVEGAGELLYLDNTDSDVFLEISTQRYFVLLSGRWYRAAAVQGEALTWEWVANDALPEAFTDIADDSATATVLPHVAGTVQAREAVLDNTIPQTAAVRRDDTSAEVSYDGTPAFTAVEGADGGLEYAQNTRQAVFKLHDRYYLCEQGVWYESSAATGPWSVSTSVPKEISTIPASNPHYNVTYVQVYDVTPQVVYVGYTPGYTNSYVSHGCVMYGTGWHYYPWYGPYYYPRPWSWGVNIRYNPWYGWSFGISFSNGPFTFSFGTWGGGGYYPYNRYPYYRPPAYWGPGGYRPYPRPTPYGGYHRPPVTTMPVTRPAARPATAPGARPAAATRPATTAQPNLYNRPTSRDRLATPTQTPAARPSPMPTDRTGNDVFTDRSGNVYRRDASGDWQDRQGGQWTPAQGLDRTRPAGDRQPSTRPSTRPAPTTPTTRPTPSTRPSTYPSGGATRPQLERDYYSRQRGASRSSSYHSSRPVTRSAAPRRR